MEAFESGPEGLAHWLTRYYTSGRRGFRGGVSGQETPRDSATFTNAESRDTDPSSKVAVQTDSELLLLRRISKEAAHNVSVAVEGSGTEYETLRSSTPSALLR